MAMSTCWIYPLIAWWIFPVRYVSFCQRVNLIKFHEKQSFSYGFPGVDQRTYWRNQPHNGLGDWPTMIRRRRRTQLELTWPSNYERFVRIGCLAKPRPKMEIRCFWIVLYPTYPTHTTVHTQHGDWIFGYVFGAGKSHIWRLWCICLQPSSNRRGKHQGN